MSKSPVLLAALCICFATPAVAQTASLDHSLWDALTHKYVNADARVDYLALKREALPQLNSYLQVLAARWPAEMPQPERKAALINAYNALTVHWILTNYPVQSIWRTKHPFTQARHSVDARLLSLDQIETELRNMGDPRIHGAIVCASRSCPPLRREAYEGARLDQQLDDNVRGWLSNPQLNQFFPERRTAITSMIFKWYASDFNQYAGSPEQFLARFAPKGKGHFLTEPNHKLEYKTYDWGLNDTTNLGEGYSAAKFYWDALRNK